QVTLSERVNLKRSRVKVEEMIPAIRELFVKITNELAERSLKTMEEMIVNARSLEALKNAIKEKKIGRVNWCGRLECAEKIREESGGEIRGHRFDVDEPPEGPCIICKGEAKLIIYVAKAY
ncbi:MAG TPA: proline--tRNA ligase, partial [Candidatus Bathyarchaeota archaeon]|nr:proline--tRNA ligase [Candidatus Bathyarchaeota archaeon]